MRKAVAAFALLAGILGLLMTVDVSVKQGRFTKWCSRQFRRPTWARWDQRDAAPASAAEWEEFLYRLKASYAVSEQRKASQADKHYRLGERYYEAGDFEKSILQCEKALHFNTSHAPARALLMEVQFILGQGKASPHDDRYDQYMSRPRASHLQVLVEIDSAFERGRIAYDIKEYGQAEREFRKILEYVKWMPTGIEVDTRRKKAVQMLETAQRASAP